MAKESIKRVKRGVLLSQYTTLKVGGKADYFFVAKTKQDLILAIKKAKELKVPFFILGGGSNLLFSDKGFKGLVIKIEIKDIDFKKNSFWVGAGFGLTKLAYLVSKKGLSGLEWVVGIPGTVGGAIFGNAQAFGVKMSDLVKKVEAVNTENLKEKIFSKKECSFSLKNSFFKKNPNWVITRAFLKLKKDKKEIIKKRMKEFLAYRKENHPLNFPSAGSAFINPQIKIKNKKLLEKFPRLKEFNQKGVIPSGFLIEKAGLAGKKIGGAQISSKHANFIINLGNASARDILALIKIAKKKVKKIFNVDLEPEIQFCLFNK